MKLLLTLFLLLYPMTADAQTAPTQPKAWKKDPFAPPFAVKKGDVGLHKATEAEHIPALELTSILFSKERSAAVINGGLHHIGDAVSGYKILDIQKTYVILSGKKGNLRLELKR